MIGNACGSSTFTPLKLELEVQGPFAIVDIASFLLSLQLEQYISAITAAGFGDLHNLAAATEHDLVTLATVKVGHAKKITKQVALLVSPATAACDTPPDSPLNQPASTENSPPQARGEMGDRRLRSRTTSTDAELEALMDEGNADLVLLSPDAVRQPASAPPALLL